MMRLCLIACLSKTSIWRGAGKAASQSFGLFVRLRLAEITLQNETIAVDGGGMAWSWRDGAVGLCQLPR